jgi:hypothetical protein
MGGQIDRLEDVDIDSRALGIEDQCRIAEASTPAGIDQRSVDLAPRPVAIEPGELMMVRPTRRQASVRRQALESRVRSRLTVPVAVAFIPSTLLVMPGEQWAESAARHDDSRYVESAHQPRGHPAKQYAADRPVPTRAHEQGIECVTQAGKGLDRVSPDEHFTGKATPGTPRRQRHQSPAARPSADRAPAHLLRQVRRRSR